MNIPDIYFDPVWGKLYAIKDNGIHHVFEYKSINGCVYYSFVKRKIDIKIDNNIYYDIITPYGFSGPIILDLKNNKKDELLSEFKNSFDDYCDENNIITDSCRFNPWLKNHLDFSHMYKLIPNFSTLGVDLTVENIFMDELSSKKRNMIRKANKLGVEINYDFEGKYIDEFLEIYKQTIMKHDISNYYFFTKDFLIKNFRELKDKIMFGYAVYNNKIISIAIFLLSYPYIHYHLAANDREFQSVPANDTLLYNIAEYGKKNNYHYLMLGGAGGNKALQSHKKGFTKKVEFDFYKGARICNKEIYDLLLKKCNKVDENFFPSYR